MEINEGFCSELVSKIVLNLANNLRTDEQLFSKVAKKLDLEPSAAMDLCEWLGYKPF